MPSLCVHSDGALSFTMASSSCSYCTAQGTFSQSEDILNRPSLEPKLIYTLRERAGLPHKTFIKCG
eukprot:jgi/Botrbrau1/10983/Bobra.0234s0008.1